jgi:hypothetical protein
MESMPLDHFLNDSPYVLEPDVSGRGLGCGYTEAPRSG